MLAKKKPHYEAVENTFGNCVFVCELRVYYSVFVELNESKILPMSLLFINI